MDEMLADILDACLVRLEGGAPVETCLAEYPEQSAVLEGPLLMASALRALPRPGMTATTRGALESRMLALAAARRAALPAARPSSPPASAAALPWRSFGPAVALAGALRALGYRGPLGQPWLRLASAVIALVLALVLGVGAFAAARAIVRRLAPQRPAPTAAPTPSPAAFSLDGVIERIDQEGWVVAGTPVALDAQTVIAGVPAVGMTAHIGGVFQGSGTRLARSITVIGPATATVGAPSAPTAAPPLPTTAPTAAPPVPTSAPPPATPAPTVAPTLVPTPTPAPSPQAQPDDGHGDDAAKCKDNGKDKGKKCKPKPHGEQDHKRKGDD